MWIEISTVRHLQIGHDDVRRVGVENSMVDVQAQIYSLVLELADGEMMLYTHGFAGLPGYSELGTTQPWLYLL
jgi:hypothetical protein